MITREVKVYHNSMILAKFMISAMVIRPSVHKIRLVYIFADVIICNIYYYIFLSIQNSKLFLVCRLDSYLSGFAQDIGTALYILQCIRVAVE